MTAASIRWIGTAALGLCTPATLVGCGSRGPVVEEPVAEDDHRLPPAPDSCMNHHDCDVVDACCRCDQGGK